MVHLSHKKSHKKPHIIGILGGTNVGKSLVSHFFLQKNWSNDLDLEVHQIQIFNADQILADLYAHNQKVINRIEKLCPEAIVNGRVYTKKLALFYFISDENAQSVNNASIQEVKQAAYDFIRTNQDKRILILDMPMLLELELHKVCDYCLFVTADFQIRQQRAITRMFREKNYDADTALSIFARILKKQTGLDAQQYQEMSLLQAADIADQRRRNILTQDSIPFIEVNNSEQNNIDALSAKIKKIISLILNLS